MSDEMDEIWALFADDGAQAMDAMETALLSLQDSEGKESAGYVAALFRAVHTFKGNSRVLGLETVESRAHLAEDLIGLVRDQGVALDDEILSLLLETGDRLREMLEETARNRADVDPAATDDLAQRLRDKIARCMPDQSGPSAEPPALQDPEQPEAPQEALPEDANTWDERGAEQGDMDSDPTEPETLEQAETAQEQATGAENPAQEDDNGTLAAPANPAPVAQPEATASASTSLSSDPVYLAIFSEMVEETLTALRASEQQQDATGVDKLLSKLSHAARQLGLTVWMDVLAVLPKKPEVADLIDIRTSIEALAISETAEARDSTTDGSHTGYFDQIAKPLGIIARLGVEFTLGNEPEPALLQETITELSQISERQGYVRVVSAATALQAAEDAAGFRQSELRLYEELASVETAICTTELEDAISPRKLLQQWSADHVFETLDELDQVLEKVRSGTNKRSENRRLQRLLRLIHHACGYFRLEVASDLSMTLLDLISRDQIRGERPDAILLQIARGFVDTLELVFDATREGETPDTERLEKLFRDATEAGFVGAGTVSVAVLERRLGLPPEFHRVLSPESTRAASLALEQGQNFYILRADINSDDRLAEHLFNLIGSGQVEALTNVTVFEGDRTLFDFLLASRLDESHMSEALARLDPAGKNLILRQRLTPSFEMEHDAPADSTTARADALVGTEVSGEIIEQLGEVAAGQAMLQNMLGDLSGSSLSETIDTVLHQNGGDAYGARQALRAVGEQLDEQLREITQLGSQILGHISELQQLTANLRTRPAATVLRALAAIVATEARSNGFEAQLTTTGDHETLDVSMLDAMRTAMQHYLRERLSKPHQAPRRLHMMVRKMDDQVMVVLDDDGAVAPSSEILQRVEEEVRVQGGHLRLIDRPEGGFRLHVMLPISLIMLEGMVVGAEKTRYIVPISAIRSILQPEPEAMVSVSGPEGRSWWLRLNSDELIPVQNIASVKPRKDCTRNKPDTDQIYIIVSLAENCVALPVDEVLGQQLVLSRPLRGVMSDLRRFSGVALLSRGDLAMVLSPDSFCAQTAQLHA